MGFWNDGLRPESPPRTRSRSRTRKDSTSTRHTSEHHHSRESPKHYATRPSNNRSVSSFFSLGGGTSSGTPRGRSYSSRARPRSGFVARIRKFLRDLYSYMRRHPVKVFFLVIMPLITGGALTKILAQFGVRLPRGLQQMVGNSQFRGMGGAETQRLYARGGARDFEGGSALPGMLGGVLGGASGGGISSGTIQSAMNIAKMFM